MPLYLAYIQTIALAIIAGGSLVLGTFLIRGFKHQLENKQSEIDTLKTQIRHLEGLTAPALAAQIKQLVPLVDEYAKRIADQEAQGHTMGPATTDSAKDFYRFGVARAMLEALGIALTIGNADGTLPSLPELLRQIIKPILSAVAQAVNGKTPTLSHIEKIIKLISELDPGLAKQLASLPAPVDN